MHSVSISQEISVYYNINMYINMGQFKIIVSPEVEQTFKGTIVIRIEQDEVRFLSSDNQAHYRSGADCRRHFWER